MAFFTEKNLPSRKNIKVESQKSKKFFTEKKHNRANKPNHCKPVLRKIIKAARDQRSTTHREARCRGSLGPQKPQQEGEAEAPVHLPHQDDSALPPLRGDTKDTQWYGVETVNSA